VSEARIIYHYETEKSRGFGFCEMPNREEAEKAIAGLDGKILKGRELRLEPAREFVKRDRPRVQTPLNSKWR
jgi:RNA recognition motif-containing protein